jgi:hypothetical protein
MKNIIPAFCLCTTIAMIYCSIAHADTSRPSDAGYSKKRERPATQNAPVEGDARHPNGIWYFKPDGNKVTANTLTANDCTVTNACDATSLNSEIAAKVDELTPYASFYLAPGSYPIDNLVLKSGQAIQGRDATYGNPSSGEPPVLQGAIKLEGRNRIENVKIDNQGLLVDTVTRNQAYVGLYLPEGVSASLKETDVSALEGTAQPTGANTVGIVLENKASLAIYNGRVSAQGSAVTESIVMTGATVAAKASVIQSASTNAMAYGINAQGSTFQQASGSITAQSERGEVVGVNIKDGNLFLSADIDLTARAVHDDERVWSYGIRANAAIVMLDQANIYATSNGSAAAIRGENKTAVNMLNSGLKADSGIPEEIENDICAGLECGSNTIMTWDSQVTSDGSTINSVDLGHGVPSSVWLVANSYLRTTNSKLLLTTEKDWAVVIYGGNSRNEKAFVKGKAPGGWIGGGTNTFINSTCIWNGNIQDCDF